MEYDYSKMSFHEVQDLVKSHELLNDIVHSPYLLPFSDLEEFQYVIQHNNRSYPTLVVKFDNMSETMSIISVADNVKCTLRVSEMDLANKMSDTSLQEFYNRLTALEFKFEEYSVSFRKELYGMLNLDDIKEAEERRHIFDILLNLRYAASKSAYIYNQLKIDSDE